MKVFSIEQFLDIFEVTFGWVQQQTHPKVRTKTVKKYLTDQSFHSEKKYY